MPQQPCWNWGSFFVYGVACFLGALLIGLLTDIPGLLTAILGGAMGFVAARREWFETG
jgi:hypothetical protein